MIEQNYSNKDLFIFVYKSELQKTVYDAMFMLDINIMP